MCYAAIGLAIGAISAIGTYAAQSQQASAQASFQRRQSAAEVLRSQAEMSQIRQRQAVQNESRSEELAKVTKEGRKLRSAAYTQAGEANIAGPSADELINDYAAQEAAIYSQSQRQAELDNIYTEQQLAASRLGTQSSLNNINQTIQRPSALAPILSIAGSAFNNANLAQRRGGWFR